MARSSINRAWLKGAIIMAGAVLFLALALSAVGAHGPLHRYAGGPIQVGSGYTPDSVASDRPCLGSGAPQVCAAP